MTEIVVSSIIDYSHDYCKGEEFDALFCDYQEALRATMGSQSPKCELKKVYVQFQYGIGTTPSATKGIKVDRYSKKGQHVCATIEVKHELFDNLAGQEKRGHLGTLLVETLKLVEAKLRDKISNEINELIDSVEEVNRRFRG